jgi:hypothetical protein
MQKKKIFTLLRGLFHKTPPVSLPEKSKDRGVNAVLPEEKVEKKPPVKQNPPPDVIRAMSWDEWSKRMDKLARRRDKTKAQIMQEQLTLLCEEYGMHAEFKAGVIFVTTVVGEWYFMYNDRPIKLRHKNYSEEYAKMGKSLNLYHLQSKKFPSPLHVINYIKRHDITLRRRLMEDVDVDEYLLS